MNAKATPDPLLQTLALAFEYPRQGSLGVLWEQARPLPYSPAKLHLERFLKAVSQLKLSEREELHTRTLDLSPLFAPYVGFAVYGEDYRRGAFMAALNREMRGLGLELRGELPDHLAPVLSYLAVAAEPLPELTELLEPALQAMYRTLKTMEPGNPYLHLLDAVRQAVRELPRPRLQALQPAPEGGIR
ncbi:hypothetical protein Mterra_01137 [Calidithermus terrae]|uniref:Nitrate reductase molybdenum cofactor assembly chaperone n=1 Tax=Calidithermus terrae TaxID=1408545 RepID=A0A399EZ72_9DEIN|nr:nitrate reductase [Calidithermus terrae]RIH87611.1 hypothetical protein Mterra_01137 [Calidithermus terrae]